MIEMNKKDIVKMIEVMRENMLKDNVISELFEEFYGLQVIDYDALTFANSIVENRSEHYYIDVDTQDVCSETDLRDWFDSMDPEDSEEYEDVENYIQCMDVMNGGTLAQIV